MRTLERFFVAMTVAALSSLPAGPTAAATEHGTSVVSLAALTLRPAYSTLVGEAAQTGEQAFLIGPGSDNTRCLDADLNTIGSNGTKIQLWTCDQYATNQAWYIRQTPDGDFRIQSAHNGRYLDADLTTINSNGTKVQLWDYIADAKNQRWALTTIPDGYFGIKSVQSDRYLDADLNTANRDGTIVQLWEYISGGKNQWWH